MVFALMPTAPPAGVRKLKSPGAVPALATPSAEPQPSPSPIPSSAGSSPHHRPSSFCLWLLISAFPHCMSVGVGGYCLLPLFPSFP